MSRKSILYVARKCFPKFSMAQEKYLNGKRWKQYSFTQLFIEFYDTLTTTLVLSSIFFFRTGIKGWSEPMAPEWYAESERSEASVMHTTNDDKIHISVKIPRRIRLGTTTCSAWVLPEFPRVATAQQYTYSQMLGERGGGGGIVCVIVKKYTVVCWIRCEFCISSILQSKQGQKQVLCQAVTVSMCVQLWQDFWNACTSMPVSCLTLKKIFKFTVRGWGLKTLQGFYGSLGS